MKTAELMLADWYYWEAEGKKYPLQVTKETFKLSDEDISNFQPISLTPEILEKNGFETKKIMPFEQEFEHKVGVDGRVELDNRSEYIRSNNTWAMYIRGDRGLTSYIELSFLHELQHALKLCKIDKEIIV